MRKIIAALQVSLDGYIEGANGEVDWIDSWEDSFDLLPEIDTFILGGGMYSGYEHYWRSILANPQSISPFTGKVASNGEIAYAQFADKTPHIVLSKTLSKVEWKTVQIVRNIEEIRRLKQQPGKSIHALGGATLVSHLMNLGLIDELRLTVHPIVLGSGKGLFKDVKERHGVKLLQVKSLNAGKVRLTYSTHL